MPNFEYPKSYPGFNATIYHQKVDYRLLRVCKYSKVILIMYYMLVMVNVVRSPLTADY